MRSISSNKMAQRLPFLVTFLFAISGVQLQLHFETSSDLTIDLRSRPDRVEKLVTENVTLDCEVDQSIVDPTDVISITDIRILKRNGGNIWTTLAELSENGQDVTSDDNVTAAGVLGQTSFVKVTWPTAVEDTFGSYKCDVIGHGVTGTSFVQESAIVVIVEHDVTVQEVLSLMLKEQAYLKQELNQKFGEQLNALSNLTGELNQTHRLEEYFANEISKLSIEQQELRNQTETDLMNLVANTERRIDSAIHRMETKLSDLEQSFIMLNPQNGSSSVENRTLTTNEPSTTLSSAPLCQVGTSVSPGVQESWPQGTYALLKPDSGCPNDTMCTNWETGYFKLSTEMDNNQNEVSNTTHLATPIQETDGNKTFMYQHFCVVSDPSQGTQWPNGSYCVNKVDEDCPPGFGLGYILYDEEDTDYNGAATVRGVTPKRGYPMYIFYCCRSDGAPDTPIVLPTSSPFYLYRYQGRCQEVQGMGVVEEYMLFDTENDNNTDAFSYRHPDGSIDNVRLQLCYYYNL